MNIKDLPWFNLESRESIIEKFGDEMAQIIIEERRKVFFYYGIVWAVFGAGVLILLIFFGNLMRL